MKTKLINTPYGRKTPELLVAAMDCYTLHQNNSVYSAAPEMFEALEAINDKLNKCFQYELSDDLDGLLRSMCDEVEAATAKAKGDKP